MNNHTKTMASKVVSSTANLLSAPARGVQAVRGAVADYRRGNLKAASNFKNRTDNTNYYKGSSYWRDNKN